MPRQARSLSAVASLLMFTGTVCCRPAPRLVSRGAFTTMPTVSSESQLGDALPRDGAAFATTRWSVVMSAGQRDTPGVLEALEQLARTYQYPVYAEVRRQGHDRETARDLTQGFFERLLAGDFFARADRAKGRFRNYLLTALNNFLADDWRQRTRQRRGGSAAPLSLDDETLDQRYRLEPAETRTPSELYERRFAISLLEEVLRRLEREFVSFGSAELFENSRSF
jgi:DNA-directed RNA polymerase specialized sigma24 family protein